MTDPDTEQQLTQAVRQLWRSRTGILLSLKPLRIVGYGLLLLGIIDLAEILIPPVFLNPRWEFQAFGQIIERVPVPLIGLGFIFLGGKEERTAWENRLVPALSWLTLIVAVVYFLLVPLGIVNTLRIDRLNQQEIAAQTTQVQEQIQQAKDQLALAKTPEELQALLSALSGREIPALPTAEGQVDELKTLLETNLEENETAVSSQASGTLASTRRDLMERSIKWNLGSLIAGALYLFVWRSTFWARRK